MKTTICLLLTLLINLNLQAADRCELKIEKTIVKSEDMVPTWNPKVGKTMLMRVAFKELLSPIPDLVQLHIPTVGECKNLEIKSLKVFRQIGPQDFSDHGEHLKPTKNISWETKAFTEFNPKVELAKSIIILKNIPAGEPAEAQHPEQHVWALKYQVEYKEDGESRSDYYIVESPLLH